MGHSGSGGEAPTANAVTVKVVKNKCAPPFRQAQFAIRFGVGICRLSEVLELAIEAGFGPSSPGCWPATVPGQSPAAGLLGQCTAASLPSLSWRC